MRLMRFVLLLATVLAVFAIAAPARAGFPAAPKKGGAAGPGPGGMAPVFRRLSSAGAEHRKYREDSILVKFKPGVSEARKGALHKRHGAKAEKKFERLRLYQLRLNKGIGVEQALKAYRSDPDVEYAEPDYLPRLQGYPNDPDLGALWGMSRINAPAAWDHGTGSGSVVVAVIDSGIDYNHPDLSANVWSNAAEAGGGSGVDDDGNGYVDDLHGIDTYNLDQDPYDDNRHGTHVSGTIGAVGNNGIGVAGVNWQVKLMACKAFGSGGYGSISAIIDCLEYVKLMKERGVNIVATNNSWGGEGYSQALYDAIAAQPDILFVAAAGNDSVNIDKVIHYPGSYQLPNIITVAAIDQSDNLAGFSDYGAGSVHVAAPGAGIYSTSPGGGYEYLDGTSMATPHVTGTAALLASTGKNWKQVKNLILSSSAPLPALAGRTGTGGVLDAAGAISCSNRPLLLVQKLPDTVQAGVPVTFEVRSVNCATPVGPVSVTLPGGGALQLLDNGAAPDRFAGDGVFTGSWTPPGSGSYSFTISSPTGTRDVAVPPLQVAVTATAQPPATVNGSNVYAAAGASLSVRLASNGGILPLTWYLASGALPPGVSLNGSTGEVSGIPDAPGVYPMTLAVTDALGNSDSGSFTLVVNQGIRPGWPKTLLSRQEDYDFISSSPVFADLDGDGKQEIIVADLNAVYVFNESSLLASYQFPGDATILATPAVADLFNDGKKEIIVSAGWPVLTAPIYVFDKDLNLLPGFPAGGFATENGSGGFVSSPVVADLNGDGQKSIVVVCSPNNVYDANYGRNVIVMVDPQGAMVPGWPVTAGSFSSPGNSQPAVGDLDKDGKKELVLLGGDGVLRILRKDGSGASWLTVTGSGDAWFPVLADFDGDGYLEIAVKQSYSDGVVGNQRLAIYDRSGALLPGWPKLEEWNPNLEIIAADLDGDGSAELIAAAGGSADWSGMTAYRGDGSSVPGWPPASPGGWLSASAAPVAGDLSGSGRQDVLYSSFDPFASRTYLWGVDAGGGALAGYPKNASLQVEVRSTPALGDLDGNGKVDVAVKANDGTLHVWEEQASQSAPDLQWPMFGHDAQHTSALVPAPGASFTATPLSGYAPLVVQFTDTSGNAPVSWSWSFGDGATSTLRHPEHSYTAPGSYSVTLTATDSQGAAATKTRSGLITVLSELTVVTSELPTVYLLDGYSHSLAASGGVAPYSWSVSAGSLPPGLSLSAGGVIAGAPGQTGVFAFTVQVRDSRGATAARELSLTVTNLEVVGGVLPWGITGSLYSSQFSASGGTPPYSWRLFPSDPPNGSLPPGLTLDGTGLISGIPTTPGSYLVTPQVSDSLGRRSERDLDPMYLVIADPACFADPVLVAGWGVSDIWRAYMTAADGDQILLRAVTYSGDIVFDKNQGNALKGGFDCGYGSNSERSVITAGRLRVLNGTAKIDQLTFR